MIGLPVVHYPVISYAAWILCLDAVAVVPLACLRLESKALRFATIKLTNIVVNVCCTVVFLLVYRMGVEGIFLSGVISSAVTLVLLIPTIASNLTLRLTGGLYASLLKFGLPYVPAGLATMMVQVIDRPILESLTDKATVGIYQANYRLGIFMMLIVSMYDFAWRPFFLLHAKDPDARELFARVLTYFVLLMTCVFLVLCFFLEGIIRAPVFFGRSILPEPYWEGFSIVPVILLAYMFLGVSTNLSAGIYIEKKTQHLPYITFAGAFINVVANFLLIPLWGIMGAAIATLLSYAAMAVILFFVVQGFYPVRYEFERIAKIVVAAGIVFVLSEVVSLKSFEFGWKLFLLGTFAVLVYWMKFFKPTEISRIASLFTRRTPLSQPPDIVQGPEG
jgi:O-antigen/teichoic acid export membrane protein